MAEVQIGVACGRKLVTVELAGLLSIIVMPEPIKKKRVGDVHAVNNNGINWHHKMGILWENGAI